MPEEKTISEILLDENNEEPVTLEAGDGTKVKFDQIATIPLLDDIFAILKPIEGIDGLGEDEAIVFYLEEDAITYVADEFLALAVFDKYYAVLEEKPCEDEDVFRPEKLEEIKQHIKAFKEENGIID